MDARAASRRGGDAPPRALAGKVVDLFVARMASLEASVEQELRRPAAAAGPAGELVLDVAREGWRALSALARTAAAGPAGVAASWTASSSPLDDCGFDQRLAADLRAVVRVLSRLWLGIEEVQGAALPASGGVLVLANRGAWPLPAVALVLMALLGDGRLGGRRIAAVWESEEIPELPWVGDFLRRIGIVSESPAGAAALLERDFVVLAFPEGAAARSRTYERRYRLGKFDAADLVDAALETGASVVPAAVLGVEESFPVLRNLAGLPLTVQFPLLGAFGLLPLPVSWRVCVGAPVETVRFAAAGAGAAGAIADAAAARVQALLAGLLAARSSIVSG